MSFIDPMPFLPADIGMDSLFATYLLTGITMGFGHCIGMCGPLVISFSLNLGSRNATLPHLAYHCGRILTYTVLGAAMGATGSFTIIAVHVRYLQTGAMLVAGGIVIVMGLAVGEWVPQMRILNPQWVPFGPLAGRFRVLSQGASAKSYLPLGLMLGLLPCGPVYTALLGAARAGMAASNVLQGMLTGVVLMAAFGLGTVPSLFIVGKAANSGWMRFRTKFNKAGALLMVALGIYYIWEALSY
jgi:sulfite exporter TauE/SafE